MNISAGEFRGRVVYRNVEITDRRMMDRKIVEIDLGAAGERQQQA